MDIATENLCEICLEWRAIFAGYERGPWRALWNSQ